MRYGDGAISNATINPSIWRGNSAHMGDRQKLCIQNCRYTEWSKKTDTQFYFWDNIGNSVPILTILSLLQAEIYGA